MMDQEMTLSHEDWRDAIASGATDLGYRDWVRQCVANFAQNEVKARANMNADPAPLLVDIAGVAKMLSISVQFVRNMVASNRFPKPIRIGRSTRWAIKTIQDWVNANAERAEHEGAHLHGVPSIGRPRGSRARRGGRSPGKGSQSRDTRDSEDREGRSS